MSVNDERVQRLLAMAKEREEAIKKTEEGDKVIPDKTQKKEYRKTGNSFLFFGKSNNTTPKDNSNSYERSNSSDAAISKNTEKNSNSYSKTSSMRETKEDKSTPRVQSMSMSKSSYQKLIEQQMLTYRLQLQELNMVDEKKLELTNSAPFTFKIEKSVRLQVGGKTFIAFVVEVISTANENDNYIIVKRYTQFKDLHRKIAEQYPKRTLPRFPSKKLIGKSSDLISDEAKQLHEYINLVAKIPGIFQTGCLKTFLSESGQQSSTVNALRRGSFSQSTKKRSSTMFSRKKREEEKMSFINPETNQRASLLMSSKQMSDSLAEEAEKAKPTSSAATPGQTETPAKVSRPPSRPPPATPSRRNSDAKPIHMVNSQDMDDKMKHQVHIQQEELKKLEEQRRKEEEDRLKEEEEERKWIEQEQKKQQQVVAQQQKQKEISEKSQKQVEEQQSKQIQSEWEKRKEEKKPVKHSLGITFKPPPPAVPKPASTTTTSSPPAKSASPTKTPTPAPAPAPAPAPVPVKTTTTTPAPAKTSSPAFKPAPPPPQELKPVAAPAEEDNWLELELEKELAELAKSQAFQQALKSEEEIEQQEIVDSKIKVNSWAMEKRKKEYDQEAELWELDLRHKKQKQAKKNNPAPKSISFNMPEGLENQGLEDDEELDLSDDEFKVCCVCGEAEPTDDFECCGGAFCDRGAHLSCVGLEQGASWFCDDCKDRKFCVVCGDPNGDLVDCNGPDCTRAAHLTCVGIESSPWFCYNCEQPDE